MTRHRSVFGSGLAPWQYGGLLALSVALFVWWDGALWSASPRASHVGRFAVSYLAVIPAAVALLAWVRRLSWTHLVTGVGTIWGIKLVVTSALYFALAPGGAARIEPARASLPDADIDRGYASASDAFAAGDVTGVVRLGGGIATDAVVLVDAPGPGLAPSEARDVVLTIAGGRYERALYVVTVDDRIAIENRDDRLYTVNLQGAGGSSANHSVPPGAGDVPVSVPAPGVYRIHSDGDETAPAWLVVVDHPYVTFADEGGRFELARVPAGDTSVTAVAVADGRLVRASRRVDVPSGARAGVELDVAQQQ